MSVYVCQVQGYWVGYLCGEEEFLPVGHTYLNCRSVTQHQGPCGPGSPTWGRGGQETSTLVGVFPPMLCYMAITPAVRQRPVRLGSGGPWKKADSRHRRPVPPLCRRRRGGWKKPQQGRSYNFVCTWKEFLDTFILFPVSNCRAPLLLPSINMYTTRHFFNLCLLVKHSRNIF